MDTINKTYNIYKIMCPHCPLVYVGMTSKSIHSRLMEHKRNIRGNIRKTKLYNHVRNYNCLDTILIELVRSLSTNKKNAKVVESRFIKAYDSVNNGLNTNYSDSACCEHSIKRHLCYLCGGGSMCPHDIEKRRCAICSCRECRVCNKKYSSYEYTRHIRSLKHLNMIQTRAIYETAMARYISSQT